jgi:hypothetical protein
VTAREPASTQEWRANGDGSIVGRDGFLIARVVKPTVGEAGTSARQRNAALIVTAVNERDGLLAENRRLREALRDATTGLDGAWQMLSAICETDSSIDRVKARDRAAKATGDARIALGAA